MSKRTSKRIRHADFLSPIGWFMLQDGVAWFHHSGNLWRNDGENVTQTSCYASTGFVPSNRLLQEQVLFILYFKTWAICIVED